MKNIKPLKAVSFEEFFRKSRKESSLLKIRMIVTYLGTLVSYFFLINLLYFQDRVLGSLIALFVFFALFHFAFLDLRHRGLRPFWYIFGTFIVVEWLFLGFGNWQILASVTILNAAAIILALWLDSETSEKRVFKSFSFFAVGGYIFTVFSVIAYSLFLLGGSNFTLTCDTLQTSSDSFVEFWSDPFERGWEEVSYEVKESQEKVKEIFDTKLKDILPGKNSVRIESTSGDNQLSGHSFFAPVIVKFNTLQMEVDNMLNDNTFVNEGICELVMGEINERFDDPAFQFSVLFLMFFMLYPFVRLAFFIISFLSFIIFKILFWLKVYKIHKVEEEIEEIV